MSVIKSLKDMRVTMVAGVLAIAMIVTAMLTNFDVVKLNLKFLNSIEKFEFDDVLCGLVLIFVAMGIDRALLRRRQRSEIEARELKTLKATMRTVQHIVNNFLNNMVLFQIEADAVMPRGFCDPLGELIQQTAQELKTLGDLESIRESHLATGGGIEYAIPASHTL
jgi:hypothetical protein